MRVVRSLIGAGLGACLCLSSACGAEEPSSGTGIGGGSVGVGGSVAGGSTGGTGAPGAIGGGTTGGGTSTPGALGGTGGTVMTPNNVCDVRTINAYEGVPDMLIVLDRSLSMSLFLRWDPSKSAVKTITKDFGGLISFGLSAFPGQGVCGAGKLDVPLMVNNAAPIGTWLDSARTEGLTPTGPALSSALQILGDRRPGLDTASKPAYVLLVTDGEPTCLGIPGIPDQGQQDMARAAVKALKDANIPTYVIGYQIDPAYQPLMNELAMLGGTTMYRPAESADQVVATFRDITKDVVKCSFELSEVPVDLKKVRVQIDGKTVPLNQADGWVINGKTVTLQGGSCDTLKNGQGHTLDARVECQDIVLE